MIFEIILSEKVQHDLFARSARDCSVYKLTVYTHKAEEVLVKRKSSLALTKFLTPVIVCVNRLNGGADHGVGYFIGRIYTRDELSI